jgi:hypothetical protein
MSRNGSGTYSLPQPPFTAGTTIASSAVNSDFSDIAAALTQSISKDGQTVYTGNQPMGGNKLTGLGVGTSPTDSVRVSQVADGAINYGGVAGGTADAITLSPVPGITAYAVGQTFTFKAASTNTGAMTVDVSTVGAGALVWPNGTAMAAGDIVAGGVYEIAVSAATPVFHLQNSSYPALPRTGGTLSGATSVTATLTMTGAAFNEAVRVDVASATTCNIGAAASNYVRITGTTTITGLGTIASGVRRKVVFGGILTLTHNATSLILPTGANITTAAGDCAEFESEGSGNWRCTDYMRASGAAVLASQQYAQAYCTVSGGVLTEQKMTGFTSVVRDSTGLFTCTLSTAMPDTNYVVEFTCGSTTALTLNRYCGEDLTTPRTSTVFHLYVSSDNTGFQDPANLNIRVYA